MDRAIDISSMADSAPKHIPSAQSGVCSYCGCTDERACRPPCHWIDEEHTVCSAPPCVERHFGPLADQVKILVKLARVGAI